MNILLFLAFKLIHKCAQSVLKIVHCRLNLLSVLSYAFLRRLGISSEKLAKSRCNCAFVSTDLIIISLADVANSLRKTWSGNQTLQYAVHIANVKHSVRHRTDLMLATCLLRLIEQHHSTLQVLPRKHTKLGSIYKIRQIPLDTSIMLISAIIGLEGFGSWLDTAWTMFLLRILTRLALHRSFLPTWDSLSKSTLLLALMSTSLISLWQTSCILQSIIAIRFFQNSTCSGLRLLDELRSGLVRFTGSTDVSLNSVRVFLTAQRVLRRLTHTWFFKKFNLRL